MKVSKIVDFTEILGEPKNTHNFNPSIAQWKDNLYLICYRTFLRYKNIKDTSYTYNPLLDPNHPWLGGPKGNTYWNIVDGYDVTSFLIIKIDHNINIYKRLNDGNSIFVHDGENLKLTQLKHLVGVDARLLFLRENHFAMIYNVYVRDSKLVIKENNNCDGGCVLIAMRILKIENNKLIAYKEQILCPEISNTIEKNWSLWLYKNHFYFSYGLSPKHTIYELYYDKDGGILCFPNPIIENYGIYGNFEEEYNLKKKILAVSTSTPAIERRNRPGRYIAVGHIKYFNEVNIELIENTPLGIFHSKTKTLQKHPIFNYLMFIYEFDPKTGDISSISDFFIPEQSDFILSFPTGLIYVGDRIAILYGDHDSSCKMIIFHENILDKLLRPFEQFDFHPKNINFFFFPQECLSKSDICKFLLDI